MEYEWQLSKPWTNKISGISYWVCPWTVNMSCHFKSRVILWIQLCDWIWKRRTNPWKPSEPHSEKLTTTSGGWCFANNPIITTWSIKMYAWLPGLGVKCYIPQSRLIKTVYFNNSHSAHWAYVSWSLAHRVKLVPAGYLHLKREKKEQTLRRLTFKYKLNKSC